MTSTLPPPGSAAATPSDVLVRRQERKVLGLLDEAEGPLSDLADALERATNELAALDLLLGEGRAPHPDVLDRLQALHDRGAAALAHLTRAQARTAPSAALRRGDLRRDANPPGVSTGAFL